MPSRHHEAIALGRLPPVPEPFGDTAELERGEHERRRAAAAPPPAVQQRAGAPIVTASRQEPGQRQVQVEAVAGVVRQAERVGDRAQLPNRRR